MIARPLLALCFVWLCWQALTGQWADIAWGLSAQVVMLGVVWLARDTVRRDDAKRGSRS